MGRSTMQCESRAHRNTKLGFEFKNGFLELRIAANLQVCKDTNIDKFYLLYPSGSGIVLVFSNASTNNSKRAFAAATP